MSKIVVAMDSFKGSISSFEACKIIKNKLYEHFPDSDIVSLPLADGGEGTLDCLLYYFNGKKNYLTVNNPLFEKINTYYGLFKNNHTAFIEVAKCIGQPLIEERKNPLITSSYGVGEMIKSALDNGCKEIIISLGGACTNDGATGVMCALGFEFYNMNDEKFIPTGCNLGEIKNIHTENVDKRIYSTKFVTFSDVSNPLYGDLGATKVFSPQKGATPEMIKLLEENMIKYAELIENFFKINNLNDLPGGGASGGLGAGLYAFLNSKIEMGSTMLLKYIEFDKKIDKANLIITGEGKLDIQSMNGKLVGGICNYAKSKNIPVIVLTGGFEKKDFDFYSNGIAAVFTINQLPETLSICMKKTTNNLEITIDNILRAIKKVSL